MKAACLVVLALVITGCGSTDSTTQTGSDASQPGVVGSEPNRVGKDDTRMEPWQRLDQFDRNYRDSLVLENTPNGEKSPPPPRQLNAAWDYVLAGNDFAEMGDSGGATQAYWAALRLAGNAQGSRSDREIVRRAAYSGLAKIAKQKNQPQWAELFDMCGGLSDAYLNGGQASEDQKKLQDLQDKINSARAAAAQAKQQADSAVHHQEFSTAVQVLFIGVGAALGGVSSITPGSTGTGATLQAVSGGLNSVDPNQVVQVANNVSSIEDQIKQANDEYDKTEKDIDRTATAATAVLMEPDQDFAIEAGKSFAAEEAGFYLVRATDQAPYLAVIDRIAADKIEIHQAVQHCRSAQTDAEKNDSLALLAQQLRDHELFVARYERRGKTPPPSNSTPASVGAMSPSASASGQTGEK